eukprot:9436831-Pyramimonas_sp.AAC.1
MHVYRLGYIIYARRSSPQTRTTLTAPPNGTAHVRVRLPCRPAPAPVCVCVCVCFCGARALLGLARPYWDLDFIPEETRGNSRRGFVTEFGWAMSSAKSPAARFD